MLNSNTGSMHMRRGVAKTGQMLLAAALSSTLAAFPSGMTALAVPAEASTATSATSVGATPSAYATEAHDGVSENAASAGDFLIAGGVQGEDWSHDGSILHIMGSTPMTVANADPNKATTQTIQIDAGVKADLTLAGVNISIASNGQNAPLDMVTNVYDIADNDGKPESEWRKAAYADEIRNKTMLYLTIASGTTNVLADDTHQNNGSPGLRCGWGSVLVIDDEVTNVRHGGSKFNLDDMVIPQNGMVPENTTLLGGQTIAEGDALSAMDADDPGMLTARGGYSCAGIGSGPKENAGTIVINGGNIDTATAFYGGGDKSSGSGIGGGYGGSGTIITINGGNVHAKAGFCGSGIGSGMSYPYSFSSAAFKADAIEIPKGEENSHGYSYYAPFVRDPDNPHSSGVGSGDFYFYPVAGDITINGGYVFAENGGHGNAIGQGCAHGLPSNRNHVIRITGGTVLTKINSISSPPPMYAIGALRGYTIITGGSVLVANKSQFQGIGNTAYNTEGVADWGDVINVAGGDPNDPNAANRKFLPDTDKVEMVTVDLSREGVGSSEIVEWDLSIGGVHKNYGSPARFDDGKLYLWMSEADAKKEVKVELSYEDDAGVVHDVAPLFRPAGSTSVTLKRYADIIIPDSYAQSLSKEYNGTPIPQYDFSEPLSTQENDVKLKDEAKLAYKYQYFDKVEGTPLNEEIVVADASAMPKDAGIIKLTLDSTEYSADPDYSKSYWGHRGIAWLEIMPLELGQSLLAPALGGEAAGTVLPAGSSGLSIGLDVDESKLLEGEDMDGLMSGFVIECVDANGNLIDYSDPKPGIYTATLNPNANGHIRDDGTIVSGGYAVKASPVTFVVADEGADVVEGVDVKVSASNGSGSGSGSEADGSVLNAKDVYDLVASNPKSGLPGEYDSAKTDIIITLNGVPVDKVDTSKPGTYDVVILNKGDANDPENPEAKDKVVFSELKVTSSRPSGGTGASGTDDPNTGTIFAPIDTTTDIRLDPSSTGTIAGDPYFEHESDKPVNILDAIQVRPEGGSDWSDWASGVGSGSDDSNGPDDPDGPGTDIPGNPSDPDGSDPSNPDGSGDGNGSGNEGGSGNGNGSNPGVTPGQLPGNVQVVVTDETGAQVDPSSITDPGTYEVTMSVKDPDTGEFVVIDTIKFHVVDTSITDTDLIYRDVPKDHWAYGYVFDIGPSVINGAFNPSDVALGYMAGYAGTKDFGPHHGIIRGDAAIVIWRMAGCPDVDQAKASSGADGNAAYLTGFADCDANPTMYWNEAIAWCAANGIVEGYGDTGEYRPQNQITREEFASIIARYAAFKGKDVASATADLSQYPDIDDVSDWAAPNMHYVVANGIMTGKGTDEGTADGTHGILDPQAHVTRAEVAKMTYMEQPYRL